MTLWSQRFGTARWFVLPPKEKHCLHSFPTWLVITVIWPEKHEDLGEHSKISWDLQPTSFLSILFRETQKIPLPEGPDRHIQKGYILTKRTTLTQVNYRLCNFWIPFGLMGTWFLPVGVNTSSVNSVLPSRDGRSKRYERMLNYTVVVLQSLYVTFNWRCCPRSSNLRFKIFKNNDSWCLCRFPWRSSLISQEAKATLFPWKVDWELLKMPCSYQNNQLW